MIRRFVIALEDSHWAFKAESGYLKDTWCAKELTQDNAEKSVKSEWINHRNDNGHNIADCSLCGKTTQWHDEDEDGIPRYCWYCGADMRGDYSE